MCFNFLVEVINRNVLHISVRDIDNTISQSHSSRFFSFQVCAVAVRNCLECQQHAQMKPIGDIVKNQKTVQGFTGTGKSAAKVSIRPYSGTQEPVIITLYGGISF